MVAHWLSSLVLISTCSLTGCGDAVRETTTHNASADDCESDFPTLTTRMGDSGLAMLQYPCPREGCDGTEALAAGATQAVLIEVPTEETSQVEVRALDESVLKLADLATSFDPCSGTTRVLAQLVGAGPGRAALSVRDAGREIDRFFFEVHGAEHIELRASDISAFDFSAKGDHVQVVLGQPVILLPQLADAQREPLIGELALHWSADNPRVAIIYTTPRGEEEQFLLDSVDGSAVILEPKGVGETRIVVTSDAGAVGVLDVQVLSRPAASYGSASP